MSRLLLSALALSLCGPALAQDGPEISRSRGSSDGIIVLWPRVVPATEDAEVLALASQLQARLEEMARQVRPEQTEARPRPQWACPRQGGCKATSLSAVLAHHEGGCAVVALVGPPGESPVKLVPWAADVQLKRSSAVFRSPPESLLIVQDFVPCGALSAALDQPEESVTAAIRAALTP